MRYITVYILSFLLLSLSWQKAHAQDAIGDDYNGSNQEYFGADTNEADIELDLKLVIYQNPVPSAAQIDSNVRKQMRYMLGLMRSRAENAAALYPKWNYHVTENRLTAPGTHTISYHVKAKGLFVRGLTRYTFTVPLNPASVFSKAQGKCVRPNAEEIVYDGIFWYHWSPELDGCPLKENEDYINVTADIRQRANTTTTYPEYERLVDSTKTIKITMFFGFSTYDYATWLPEGNQDWGIIGYNQQRDLLKRMGFTESTWNRDQVVRIYHPSSASAKIPYVVEENLEGPHAKIRIRLILSDTGLEHNSAAFHSFLQEALANESVVIYNGHSGLGKNLDLSRIESLRKIRIRLNPNYQIYFLGSCVPYAYYTDMFFARKHTAADPNGTKNLDIFTYGQESTFANEQDQYLTAALVKWAKTGQKTSYQDIVRPNPRYYFGINGDEDNPTHP